MPVNLTNLKAVIIDDEVNAAKGMVKLLEIFCPEIQIVGLANGGIEGVRLIQKEKPNLIFLDIEMPDLDGFQVLEQLKDISINVIFTTANYHYTNVDKKFDFLYK